MKKYGLILLFFSSIIYAQKSNDIDRIFNYIQLKQYEKAIIVNKKNKTPLTDLFNSHLNYLIYGEKFDLKKDFNSEKTNKATIIYNLILGEQYINQDKPNDTLAFKMFTTALHNAKQLKNKFYVKLTYQKLCELLLKNNYSKDIFNKTIKEYQKIADNNVDLFWIEYYLLSKRIKNKNLSFKKGYQYATTPFLKARLLQLEGIRCANFTNDLNKANQVYNEAIDLLKPYDNYYVIKKRIKKIQFNIGILHFNKGNFKQAIQIFKKIDLNKNYSQIRLFRYHWLYKCYDSINKIDSAYYYNIKFNQLKDSIDKKGQAMVILKKDKNNTISQQNNTIKSLNTKINTIIPVASLSLILLAIVFYLYKKYYKKTESLQEEKSETLEKLDELKNIVIKNHIILKDKTKVYITDLLYIKSDDHYLKVYLSNGKNHFVRGKLSKIIEELPPNFIRSHRSYIVNRNFIKQINNTNIILIDTTEIPLSRTYKDKL